MIVIIIADSIVNKIPIKNKPVLAIKNEDTKATNKPISAQLVEIAKIAQKNLIINNIILNKPLINLYSLCSGSLIIIFLSSFLADFFSSFFSSSLLVFSSVVGSSLSFLILL